MKIKLFISTSLARYSQDTSLELKRGDVQAALDTIGIPESELGFVLVNGKRGTLDQVLHDNDRLEIYPRIVEG